MTRGSGPVAVGGAAAAMLITVLPAAASDPRTDPAPPPPGAPLHSSDGRSGPLAGSGTVARLLRQAGSRITTAERRVVPGVRYESWREETPDGPVVGHLLRVRLQAPGVRLQYASLGKSRHRGPLTQLLSRRRTAVAGVNGDFFDIDDTGAPLGAAVSSGRVLGGPRDGWVTAFSVVGARDAKVRTTRVAARVVERPGIAISGVNIPQIPRDGIGLYTPRWGVAAGSSVVEGAPARRIHQVVVRRGRVVSSSGTLSSGRRVSGRLLVGRGQGAEALRSLRVGARVRIAFRVLPVRERGRKVVPRMAVGGSTVLVHQGDVVVADDLQLHPRTAAGVDLDTATLLLVVVDGRSEESRGHTLAELAVLMEELGAETALNLDGGGSSTMATRRPGGRFRVDNSPSDGRQREVPNGIAVTYQAPRR